MRIVRSSSPAQVHDLKDLTPDPHNANRGTDRGRDALARSLRDYGAGRAVLIDRQAASSPATRPSNKRGGSISRSASSRPTADI